MLAARRLCAAAASSGGSKPPPKSAWESFKTKFKAKWMIGDTYEHYIPPRPEFQNRDSSFGDTDTFHYRVPSPGSQPPPNIPRGYPETEYDVSLAKRPMIKRQAPPGVTPAMLAHEAIPPKGTDGVQDLPAHVPMPSWIHKRDQLKRLRRHFLETGQYQMGVPHYATGEEPFYPIHKHNVREEWEDFDVIRDIRIPRL
jgi:hypothetical protein